MEDSIKQKRYFSIIESVLFVSGEPISLNELSNILEEPPNLVKTLMEKLMKIYEEDELRGIKIFKTGSSYQFGTKNSNEDYILKLLKTNQRQSLSQAAIETISIIAYKQPITRVEIDEIRGVRSEKAIQILLEKNLIRQVGKLETIGRPILYGTTDNFLKQFGLENISELPDIDSFEVEVNTNESNESESSDEHNEYTENSQV